MELESGRRKAADPAGEEASRGLQEGGGGVRAHRLPRRPLRRAWLRRQGHPRQGKTVQQSPAHLAA